MRNLSTAIAMIFFLAAAIGSALMGVTPEKETTMAGRRRLSGPGSSPPTCRSRCDRCFPCRPVHVAIQPGRSFPLEYYPEAWRCKCGNRFFMP